VADHDEARFGKLGRCRSTSVDPTYFCQEDLEFVVGALHLPDNNNYSLEEQKQVVFTEKPCCCSFREQLQCKFSPLLSKWYLLRLPFFLVLSCRVSWLLPQSCCRQCTQVFLVSRVCLQALQGSHSSQCPCSCILP
jgi:hypothetical protein